MRDNYFYARVSTEQQNLAPAILRINNRIMSISTLDKHLIYIYNIQNKIHNWYGCAFKKKEQIEMGLETDILAKSPINYTGNKFRILKQLLPLMPTKIKIMLDLFCGGATVGANSNAEKTYFVDNNIRVIELLDFFANTREMKNLVRELIEITDEYDLSCSHLNGYSSYKKKLTNKNTNNGLKEINSAGFYKLREDYNKLTDKSTEKAYKFLYLLIVYGFNNDMRFSSKGNYNLPIGKTDLSKNNINKILEFSKTMKGKKFEFICDNFYSKNVKKLITKSDFIYLDPPYLITTAVYNENGGWSNELEYKLLELLEYMLINNKNFMLSNVLQKKGIRNEPLAYWLDKNKEFVKVVPIDYHYRSASYNKKDRNAKEEEIVVIPKEYHYD